MNDRAWQKTPLYWLYQTKFYGQKTPFCYPVYIRYNSAEKYPEALDSIKQVGLPKKDPVFGEKGALFTYWHAPSVKHLS